MPCESMSWVEGVLKLHDILIGASVVKVHFLQGRGVKLKTFIN